MESQTYELNELEGKLVALRLQKLGKSEKRDVKMADRYCCRRPIAGVWPPIYVD